MSPAERRALLTLLGLVVTGQGVRTWLLGAGEAPGAVTLVEPSPASRLASHQATSRAAGRPLAAGERLDLNTATAADLIRLPRIGPTLARRIIADREALGPFSSLEALRRVPGVGAAVVGDIAPHVVQPRGLGAGAAGGPGAGVGPLDLNAATEAELLRLPGIGPTKARAIVAYRQSRGPFASVEEVVRVPGIGPATLAGLRGLVVVR